MLVIVFISVAILTIPCFAMMLDDNRWFVAGTGKVSTFEHATLGGFTLARSTARDYGYSAEAIEAAALLIMQSGE